MRKNHKFLVDWLQFTVFKNVEGISSAEALMSMFNKAFPFTLINDMPSKPLLNFTHGWVSKVDPNDDVTIGIKWYCNEYHPEYGVHVIVSGSALGHFCSCMGLSVDNDDYALAYDMLHAVKKIDQGVRFTRIDLAFDDYSKKFMPFDYMNFYINHRLGFNGGQTPPRFVCCTRNGGGTAYFGSRTSRRQLRIYDKNVESKGQIDAVRYEAELRSEYAERAAYIILDREEFSFGDLIKMFVTVYNPVGYVPSDTSKDAIYQRQQRAGIDPEFEALFETQVSRSVDEKKNLFKVDTRPRLYKIDKRILYMENNLGPQVLISIDIFGFEEAMRMLLGSSYNPVRHPEVADLKYQYEVLIQEG